MTASATTASPRALVTGAGARLGRAMALALGGAGFDVAVHYNGSRAGAEEVATGIIAMGRKAAVLQADLLDDAQAEALVPAAAKALGGPLTLLVNNASIFEYDNLHTATAESWHRHFGSNLRAPFLLAQAFAAQAPGALSDARGEPQAQALIVNMLDQRILKPTPEFMTYALAKQALWAFTRTAAQGLAPHVRVNGIAPGPTLRGGRQTDAHFAAQRQNTVLGRGSNPEDVTAALLYLVAAPGVTGQAILVDGGQHLAWKTADVLGTE